MRAGDGVICSTALPRPPLRVVNPRRGRAATASTSPLRVTRPERDHVDIGWAGGTGHSAPSSRGCRSLRGHARAPGDALHHVGQPFADVRRRVRHPSALSIPFAAIEPYPAAMTHFDIALAPAGKGDFFKGKSDLRWLEAAALGIPCIADPDVYPESSTA